MQPTQTSGSVSRIPITVELQDIGCADGELIRHLAPLTTVSILKTLPISGIAHRLSDKAIYIQTNLIVGAEKQRTQFRSGEIAYMLSGSAICIFIKDSTVSPMNPIGQIKNNLDSIANSRTGSTMTIKKLH